MNRRSTKIPHEELVSSGLEALLNNSVGVTRNMKKLLPRKIYSIRNTRATKEVFQNKRREVVTLARQKKRRFEKAQFEMLKFMEDRNQQNSSKTEENELFLFKATDEYKNKRWKSPKLYRESHETRKCHPMQEWLHTINIILQR
uniref:Uncharacterized protein n=1 Tax=Megaselia scalaris TaxID=36166 RepID=T1GZ50_MEGSC